MLYLLYLLKSFPVRSFTSKERYNYSYFNKQKGKNTIVTNRCLEIFQFYFDFYQVIRFQVCSDDINESNFLLLCCSRVVLCCTRFFLRCFVFSHVASCCTCVVQCCVMLSCAVPCCYLCSFLD